MNQATRLASVVAIAVCVAACLMPQPAYKTAIPVSEEPVDVAPSERDPLLQAAGRGFVRQMQDPTFEIKWMYFLGAGWAALQDDLGIVVGRQVAVTVYSQDPKHGCIHWSTNLAQLWLDDQTWGEPYFEGGDVQTVTCESLDALMARHPRLGFRGTEPAVAEAAPPVRREPPPPADLASKAKTPLSTTPFRIQRKGKVIAELRGDGQVYVDGKMYARIGDDNILYDAWDKPLLAIDAQGAIWQDRTKQLRQTGHLVDGTLTWNMLRDTKVTIDKGRFSLAEKGTTRASNERILSDDAGASATALAIVFLRLDVLTWKR